MQQALVRGAERNFRLVEMPKPGIPKVVCGLLCLVSMSGAAAGVVPGPAAADDSYLQPPREIVELVDAPVPDRITVSPNGRWALVMRLRGRPTIAERAVPARDLAGIRINTRTNGPYDTFGRYAPYTTEIESLQAVDLQTHARRPVAAPASGMDTPFWAPDGRHFAFLRTGESGIHVWAANTATGRATRVTGRRINAANLGGYRGVPPCTWMPDSVHLLCQLVPEGRPEAFEAKRVVAPTIQETAGAEAPVWTFPNLLQNAEDEQAFDFFMTSQPALIDIESGDVHEIGAPGIFQGFVPSPDRRFFLVTRVVKPYSMLLPSIRFAKTVDVVDVQGGLVARVGDLPIDDSGVSMGWAADGKRSSHRPPLSARRRRSSTCARTASSSAVRCTCRRGMPAAAPCRY